MCKEIQITEKLAIFVTAYNQKFGSRFHSYATKVSVGSCVVIKRNLVHGFNLNLIIQL